MVAMVALTAVPVLLPGSIVTGVIAMTGAPPLAVVAAGAGGKRQRTEKARLRSWLCRQYAPHLPISAQPVITPAKKASGPVQPARASSKERASLVRSLKQRARPGQGCQGMLSGEILVGGGRTWAK